MGAVVSSSGAQTRASSYLIPGVIEQQRAYRRGRQGPRHRPAPVTRAGFARYHKSRTELVMGGGASIRGEAGR
jgi:hypothetical protein